MPCVCLVTVILLSEDAIIPPDRVGWSPQPDVQAEYGIRHELVEYPFLEHQQPPSSPSGAPSSAGWNRNMTVPGRSSPRPASTFTPMTSQHDYRGRRRVRYSGTAGRQKELDLLGHRQCIHVCAQCHDGAFTAPQNAYNAGVGYAGVHFHAEGLQVICNKPCRAKLPHMNIPPPGDNLIYTPSTLCCTGLVRALSPKRRSAGEQRQK